jgi:hypothetical protein
VDDILRSRAKTVGIVEQKFKYNGNLIFKNLTDFLDNQILMVRRIKKLIKKG